MPKKLVKCFYCGDVFDANSQEFTKPRTNRYAHKACTELHEKEMTKEERDKEELFKYIKELFQITTISSKIRSQIKTYLERDKYTYAEILGALRYSFDIKGNRTERANNGIGIVSWVMDESKRYYKSIKDAREKNEQIDMTLYLLPTREIRIKSPERCPMRRLKRLFTFLDSEEEFE